MGSGSPHPLAAACHVGPAGVRGAVPSRRLHGLGSGFILLPWFQFQAGDGEGARGTELGRRRGQSRCGAPGVPALRPARLLASAFTAKVEGSRSSSPRGAGRRRLSEGGLPFPLRPGHPPGDLSRKYGGLPESPLPTQQEGVGQPPRQNRMWVTQVSRPGTVLVRSPAGWQLLSRLHPASGRFGIARAKEGPGLKQREEKRDGSLRRAAAAHLCLPGHAHPAPPPPRPTPTSLPAGGTRPAYLSRGLGDRHTPGEAWLAARGNKPTTWLP